MISKCLLETDGYRVIFELKSLDMTKEYVDTVIKFLPDPRLSNVSLKSIPTFIGIQDLHRLVTYFEKHIASLQTDPDSESYTFVTTELGFQIQSLSGEVRSPQDGEFTIRFMVNIGRIHEESSSTYVGGESMVNLKNIQSFISSIQAALVEFSHLPEVPAR